MFCRVLSCRVPFVALATVASAFLASAPSGQGNGTERAGFPGWNIEGLSCRFIVVESPGEGKEPGLGYYEAGAHRPLSESWTELRVWRVDPKSGERQLLPGTKARFLRKADPEILRVRRQSYRTPAGSVLVSAHPAIAHIRLPEYEAEQLIAEGIAVLSIASESASFGIRPDGTPIRNATEHASCSTVLHRKPLSENPAQHAELGNALASATGGLDLFTQASMITLSLLTREEELAAFKAGVLPLTDLLAARSSLLAVEEGLKRRVKALEAALAKTAGLSRTANWDKETQVWLELLRAGSAAMEALRLRLEDAMSVR